MSCLCKVVPSVTFSRNLSKFEEKKLQKKKKIKTIAKNPFFFKFEKEKILSEKIPSEIFSSSINQQTNGKI